MAGIQEYLELIKNAVYGRDVRQAIHDGIEECYKDGKAGSIDLIARQQIAELVAPSGEAPSPAEVTDARIGADGTTYTSLGLANRTQFSNLSNIINSLGAAPTDPYLTSGGNMRPNNRIKYSRIACHKGDLVRFTLTNSTAGFDVMGGFTVYTTQAGDTLVYDSPWYDKNGLYEVPNDGFLDCNFAPINGNQSFSSATDCDGCAYLFNKSVAEQIIKLFQSVDTLEKATNNVSFPLLRNGSAGNASNADAVCTKYVLPINSMYDKITVEFMGDRSLADEYAFAYCLFSGASDGMETTTAVTDNSIRKKYVNSDAEPNVDVPCITINLADMTGYEHVSFFLFRRKNGTMIPIRISTDQYSLKLIYDYGVGVNTDNFAIQGVKNARHIPENAGTPITLLHFSDLHGDRDALSRIRACANDYGTVIDDIICTGDIVPNTAVQIASWWDKDVLTCIGNHDSATYNSSTGYNWTALSMAERDSYYIAPFESNWGIVHTGGTSYYYKDYASAKVRLIVMDAMLYTDNGADALAQTQWLAGLLTDAISNNLHVLIAIHAPHGGSSPIDCSFSKYGEVTMPVWTDCNTPQIVIDTVSNAIESGLNFIGYIVGHTHQDNVWDAEGDRKQLMYCITCAAVTQTAQWYKSDQFRDEISDAFNLVTIDTTNMLIKIVRGGGADIDNHMRTRKAICFNYSTGEKVGEFL